jgi:hypothetical protein
MERAWASAWACALDISFGVQDRLVVVVVVAENESTTHVLLEAMSNSSSE